MLDNDGTIWWWTTRSDVTRWNGLAVEKRFVVETEMRRALRWAQDDKFVLMAQVSANDRRGRWVTGTGRGWASDIRVLSARRSKSLLSLTVGILPARVGDSPGSFGMQRIDDSCGVMLDNSESSLAGASG